MQFTGGMSTASNTSDGLHQISHEAKRVELILSLRSFVITSSFLML